MSGPIEIFVVGAHLTGMALNKELVMQGGVFVREAKTAPDYRFYTLANTTPPKPGLIRAPGYNGPGITGEIWSLPAASFGVFVAAIPAPLGIGKITLAGGGTVSGFLCEAYAVDGAAEITSFGGWRAFLASQG